MVGTRDATPRTSHRCNPGADVAGMEGCNTIRKVSSEIHGLGLPPQSADPMTLCPFFNHTDNTNYCRNKREAILISNDDLHELARQI